MFDEESFGDQVKDILAYCYFNFKANPKLCSTFGALFYSDDTYICLNLKLLHFTLNIDLIRNHVNKLALEKVPAPRYPIEQQYKLVDAQRWNIYYHKDFTRESIIKDAKSYEEWKQQFKQNH